MRKLIPILFGLFVASTSHATSHRTFVAAEGADSGTCGPTAPCRSLDYALSQTNSGGEIIIASSGGYGNATGGVTIAQSVSIIAAPGVFAALAPSSGNGITIATPLIDVAIKGLTINSRGGDQGISMTNGASLDLDNVTLTNFTGRGISITTPARVMVKNSTLKNVFVAIYVGYGANLAVSNTKMTDVGGEGIEINGGTGTTTVVTATETLVRCKNQTNSWAFDNFASPGTLGKMYLDRVTASNCQYGVLNEPVTPDAANVVALNNSFITGNAFGISNNNPINTFLSSGNNHIANNASNDVVGAITSANLQ